MNEITYDWELFDADDQWVAGGSCPELAHALDEGNRYLTQYVQDGPNPHTLTVRKCTTVTIIVGVE